MIYKCEYCKTHTAHSAGMKMECVNCGAPFNIKKELSRNDMLLRLANQQRAMANQSMLAASLRGDVFMSQQQSNIYRDFLNSLGSLF